MRDDGKEKEMKAEGSETKREMAYETWGMKSIVWREKKGTSEIKEVDGNEKQKKGGVRKREMWVWMRKGRKVEYKAETEGGGDALAAPGHIQSVKCGRIQ